MRGFYCIIQLFFLFLHPEMKRIKRQPPFWLSIIPLLCLITLLTATIAVFGSDALNGGSQLALLASTAICISLSLAFCGTRWHRFEEEIVSKVKDTTISIYILLLIGCLSASWMISGIVPTLICYGIQIIHPQFFLVSACIISAVVSLMTGSSWTTIATIGIALLGIGRAEGFADGWIAGAIISGAYFGDKISPLSDTTVLASSSSGVPLFQHIRYMLQTTVPTILITIVIFTIAGGLMSTSTESDVSIYLNALSSKFVISPWLLIVPVITAWLIYKKVPSLVVLFASALMASFVARIVQPDLIREIAGCNDYSASTMYRGVLTMLSTSTSIETGNPLINSLVETSGMSGMLNTIWLILCATCFGGAMTASGMLRVVLRSIFSRLTNSRIGLVTSTVMNGLTMNLVTGDQYMSIILTANMFSQEYKDKGYENRLLSRSCEDGATVTSVLIPWNTCGMTQSTVLGVATLAYLPYCFFCYLSPLMSIAQAAWTGRKERA